MNDNFKKFMLGFITELNVGYGFKISTDRAMCVFKVCSEYDFFDEEEVKNVLSSILCQNHEEKHIFSGAFASYFNQMKILAEEGVTNFFIDDLLHSLEEKRVENEERITMERSSFSAACAKESVNDAIAERLEKAVGCIHSENPIVLLNVLKKDGAQIFSICTMKEKEQRYIIAQIENEMQQVMLYVIEEDLGEDLVEAILDASENFSRLIAEYKEIEEEHNKSSESIEKEIKKVSKQISKFTSKKHRTAYIEGHNAVQTEKGYLYKDFNKLDEDDFNKIRQYIKRNALSVKTKLFKAMRQNKIPKLDYKKTMKAAARTDMCPMTLFFKNHRKEKIKIICITDISGSCKNASQILMTFIYALQEAFPGGVESFVFVKQLNEATDIFRSYSLKEANERTSILVERDYSNYKKAFEQFDENYFNRVTKDTFVIYLGDARNNNNATGEEYLEKIRKKVKTGKGKMFWLNPEPEFQWDSGDSIMDVYKKYMDKTFSVKNTWDLSNFVNTLFK